MTTPLHKNSCPEGHEIFKFGRLFLGYHYYALNLYAPCSDVERKIFLMNTSNLHFLPHNYPPPTPWGEDHEIYIFLSSYPTHATHIIKIGPVVLERKKLTDDARRTTDDGRRS